MKSKLVKLSRALLSVGVLLERMQDPIGWDVGSPPGLKSYRVIFHGPLQWSFW